MGEFVGYTCEKCGYSFTAEIGVGFAFPMVYAEMVAKMKSGELGDKAKRFFIEHPDGAIDCENVIMRCENCGEYDSRESLAMYIPKPKYIHQVPGGSWSVAMPFKGSDYVSWYELEECYMLYAEYPHKCEICGGDIRIVETAEDECGLVNVIEPIICPHCGIEMQESIEGNWD